MTFAEVTPPALIQKISVINLEPQANKIALIITHNAFIAGLFQSKVEVCRAADIFVRVDAVITVRLIQGPRTFLIAGIKIALVVEEMAEPVILRPVLLNRFLHA